MAARPKSLRLSSPVPFGHKMYYWVTRFRFHIRSVDFQSIFLSSVALMSPLVETHNVQPKKKMKWKHEEKIVILCSLFFSKKKIFVTRKPNREDIGESSNILKIQCLYYPKLVLSPRAASIDNFPSGDGDHDDGKCWWEEKRQTLFHRKKKFSISFMKTFFLSHAFFLPTTHHISWRVKVKA